MRNTHVYFIKPIGMDGPIKIGCSDKPARRLITLAAWSPFGMGNITDPSANRSIAVSTI